MSGPTKLAARQIQNPAALVTLGTSAGATLDTILLAVNTRFASVLAGEAAFSNGTTTVSVTFSTAYTNTNYAIVPVLQNTTDANPQLQPITITAKSTTGFTAMVNSPVNTANYLLSWVTLPNN